MTTEEALRKLGITSRAGRSQWKTTCPRCSNNRKHKRDPCLSVKVDADGFALNCKNCGWADGTRNQRDDRKMVRRQGDIGGNTKSYRSLQRAASPKWR